MPATVDASGHIDASPAELTWGALASAGGAAPSFDRAAATCSGVYCHGSTLPSGGTNTKPLWTTVNGTQAACGTCHGLPPASPHPNISDCSLCHGMVVDKNLNFLDPSRHINGSVDVSETSCNSCHGSAANAAPPVDTLGQGDVGQVTVGAH